MTRTKSMVVRPSAESRELALFIDNEEAMHRWISDICKNLNRKIRKGIFDADKAIDAFYPVAVAGAKLYNKTFGTDSTTFSVTNRFSAAAELLNLRMDQIENS